jgi:serine/threonine-protein phosphatase PGAM5
LSAAAGRLAACCGVALLLALVPLAAAKKPVPAKPAPEPAPAPRTIVLLRHAQYAPDPSADPKVGPGLTPFGIAQARLTGARLAGLPFRFDAVLSSPMTRAQQTARVVAADMPGTKIDTVEDLAECTPPTPRIAPGKEGSAEEMAECAARLDRIFAEHFKPAQGQPRTELLVCHGNVIRYLIAKSMHVDTQAWAELSVAHTSLNTVRVFADGSMLVIGVGDVGHIPPSMQSGRQGDGDRTLSVP